MANGYMPEDHNWVRMQPKVKVKQGDFRPDHAYVDWATKEFLAKGGKIQKIVMQVVGVENVKARGYAQGMSVVKIRASLPEGGQQVYEENEDAEAN